MVSETLFEIALPKNNNFQLIHIKQFVEQTNESYRIPVLFELNQDRLFAYHPDHITDYCALEIKLWAEGRFNIIGGTLIGQSRQWKKKVYSVSSADYLNKSYWGNQLRLENSSELLFRFCLHSLRSAGYNDKKMQEEDRYYQNLVQLVKITFNAQ